MLLSHLQDYLKDLKARGRNKEYIYITEKRLSALFLQCCWKNLNDASPDGFIKWRARNEGKSATTLNQYLATLSGFFGWLTNQNRIPNDPFRSVGKVDKRGKIVRLRRALSLEELTRLLIVSEQRRTVYLTAAMTGLRRNELASLRMSDIHLESADAFLTVRALNAKNRKEAKVFLHPDVVEALRPLVADVSAPERNVFPSIPTVYRLKKDLANAGIPFEDVKRGRADFHALRHTFSTMLAIGGIDSQIRKEMMRHSDIRLTTGTYTDASQLPIAAAVGKLPRFSISECPQPRPQTIGAIVPLESFEVTREKLAELEKPPVLQSESPALSLAVTGLHDLKLVAGLGFETSEGRDETAEDCSKNLTIAQCFEESEQQDQSLSKADCGARHKYAHSVDDSDLQAVIDAWPRLPVELRKAVVRLTEPFQPVPSSENPS